MSVDADLRAGQSLKIPNRVSNLHNDHETNKPYNASAIIGDLTPTLPDPPPVYVSSGGGGGGGGGCGGGGFFSILVVVIAVAVTVVTAGAAAIAAEGVLTMGEVFTSGLYSLGEIAGAGVGASLGAADAAISSMAGNLAGQVAGNVFGTQNGFDFSGIAMAGISAGISSGISSTLGDVFETAGLKGSLLEAAAGTALRDTVNQGLNVLAGKQESFDWKHVAVSAITAAVVGQVTGSIKGTDSASQLQRSVLANLTQQGLTSAFYGGGRLNYASIAQDAFRNLLGNDVAYAEQEGASQQEDSWMSSMRAPMQMSVNANVFGGSGIPEFAVKLISGVIVDPQIETN